MFDAVIFDLDGTLIDTESVAITTGVQALARVGLPDGQDLLHRLIGKDIPTCAAILHREHPEIDHDLFHRHWREAFDAQIESSLRLKPGVTELLERLPLPRALCTSSSREAAHHKLGLAGLKDAFAHVVTLDDVRAAKPHPEPYLLTAERLGVSPARCVVFEDSETGAASAKAAGCHVVQVPDILPTDGRNAHHVASSLLEGARAIGLIN